MEKQRSIRPYGFDNPTYYDNKNFIRCLNDLEVYKKDFTMKSSGSIVSLHWNNLHIFTFLDPLVKRGVGFHLISKVKSDIDTLWEKKEVPFRSKSYKEQYFNLENLERASGFVALSIDISDCYWTTAFKLGYISHKTYIMGKNRGKDWKIGRVAAIGSLAKRLVIKNYVGGKYVFGKSMTINMPLKYQYARNNIIGYVYDMFKQLYDEIRDGYLMFLTDCVVVDLRFQKYVERFLTDNGYRYKYKPIEIIGVDREKKAVHWYDFTEDKEGKDKNKYYQYSSAQLSWEVPNFKVDKETNEIKEV